MFKLIFYVPLSHSEAVKEAVFEIGAGLLGNYSHCSFESKGLGQFKPLAGANPSIGSVNTVERVDELRVEILCPQNLVRDAVDALKTAHPYEEPAFEIIKIEELKNF